MADVPVITLVGDTTYASFVFTPDVPGVDQVEVTLRWDDDAAEATAGERTFTMADHERAEAYTRLLAAVQFPTDQEGTTCDT